MQVKLKEKSFCQKIVTSTILVYSLVLRVIIRNNWNKEQDVEFWFVEKALKIRQMIMKMNKISMFLSLETIRLRLLRLVHKSKELSLLMMIP